MEGLLLKDLKQQIENSFIDQGWIMVLSFGQNFKGVQQGGLYSTMVNPSKVPAALKNYSWEIHFGSGRPGFVSYFEDNKEITKYYRHSIYGYEPLIFYREQFGNKENYLELSEEFRLYHNLYENFISHDKKEYIYVDSNGDDEVVAKIGKNEAFVKLKFLKDFISAKGMHFLVYFDFMRFSEKTLTELDIKKLNKNYSTKHYFYNHIIADIQDRYIKKYKTQSWIMGKVLVKNLPNYKPNFWGSFEDGDDYVEFIINYDENGSEKYFTCNEDKLGNYFGKNPDAPLYVTPVFFKKDVLKKYYDNPSKYTVEDGYISCQHVWSLRLDNSCRDYVIVLLGDLGKLHYKEQLYWKSYNIPPRKEGFSTTAIKRFFGGIPCNPDIADLHLKMRLTQFNDTWFQKYNWIFFKPLSQQDSHYLKSLHLMTSNENEKEFDEQILSLTKIFIDSLNEEELVKDVVILKENAKGIDKLEVFLNSKGLESSEMIDFLRKIQSLRSTSIAHRRGSNNKNTQKIYEYFDIGQKPLNEILENIFSNFIRVLNTLDHFLIKSM